ncbi:FecR family protein [Sphingobacterium faecale]|uniref:FecR domain-containing protein n=1 Tax=Sphingobacterium faecale TaxID=2803775 RepID=A0ABS1R3Z9_9SPHI|nr:FecR family protein [Sphingobacterium faecale]MBL1409427.1 FecR domain-containing protein [Sphingobacterium faecale]
MNDPKELIEKYRSGNCTTEELAILHRWIHQINRDKESKLTEEQLMDAKRAFELQFKQKNNPIRRVAYWRVAAAASVILFVSIGLYFVKKSPTATIESSITGQIDDILPGKDAAILTVGTGQKINLDELFRDTIMYQNGTTISKNEEGALVYFSPVSAVEHPNEFHVLSTPSKGQHRVILPDGSKIWVNSLSSLKFPTTFSSSSRDVELSGEAYFEIAKDSERPFYVHSKGQKVKVLGTHFNIKSYDDEPTIKTTLLEGSIQLYYANLSNSRLLKAGEQAVIANGRCAVNKADIEQVMDWKNGDFIFRQESIAHIMKRVSRWYGIDVAYEIGIDKSQTISGQVSRSKNLSEVIHCLESASDLQFTIKEGKVIITTTN